MVQFGIHPGASIHPASGPAAERPSVIRQRVDYDSTLIPLSYHSSRQLDDGSMRRWLSAIRQSAPMKPGRLLADVGCGTGRFSSGLAELYQSRVIGFDRSVKMLSQARARNRQGWFSVGNADALPLLAGSMGMLFLSNVIHHLPDLRKAAVGFLSALEPGGFVVIRNYLREHLRELPYLEFFPEAMELSKECVDSKKEVEGAFTRAGFQLVSYQKIEQPVADSPLQYFNKIRARVYSDLTAIPDQAYGAGLARMATAVSTGWGRSLTEPVGLLAFQKAAAV